VQRLTKEPGSLADVEVNQPKGTKPLINETEQSTERQQPPCPQNPNQQ